MRQIIFFRRLILFPDPFRVSQWRNNFMRQPQPVRVIKRAQRTAQAEPTPPTMDATSPQSVERALRKVIAGWINEHRQRSARLQLLSLPALIQ